jgi:hypothetical protein
MKASDVINRVRVLLNDDGTRWPNSELFYWISDAQRLIGLVRPDAVSALATVSLSAGSKQVIPSGMTRLLDVLHNVNSLDGTPTRSIKITDRDQLETQDPNWQTKTKKKEVRQYIFDPRTPTTYFVTPPNDGTGWVELLCQAAPVEVTDTTTDLVLQDIYLETAVNYVMYRAYSKDNEFSANSAAANNYLQLVLSVLGLKTLKDVAASPAMNVKAGQPDIKAIQAGGI